MPIQITTAYRVGELVFPTIQQAQKKEILDLMCAERTPTNEEDVSVTWIVNHADEIIAILTCAPKSKGPRKPRSDIGKKRKAKDAEEQAAA